MHNCLCCNGAAHSPSAGGRRRFMVVAAAAGLSATGLSAPAAVAAPDGFKTKLTPEEALRALREGNERFAADAPFRPGIGAARRAETTRGQGPFASFVSCADSRVSPELVFSRGIGELFVVRTAGNVADAVALGSIEYSVAVLGVPLLVVMGHSACGAVAAAMDMAERGTAFPGSIGDVARPIVPAVQAARGRQGDLLGNAVRENAVMVAQGMVARSPVLQDAVRKDRLRVVAAHYGLADGRVQFLGG